VVYGIDTDETGLDANLATSFHYDAVFGTALNRFVTQAVSGIPLTVYGKGRQTRGFLDIRDTLRCVELAILNPPEPGEFRVFNQFTERFSVSDLAEKVQRVAAARGLNVAVDHIANPRIEAEEHYYNPVHSALPALGLEPHLLTDEAIDGMVETALAHRHRVEPDLVLPDIKWKQR
jgi:UDP-sulfoquinovose synthase